MHEASLVQGLLKIALKTVEDHNAAHPEQRVRRIRSITFNNLLDAPDQCLEWHAWYADADDRLWQIDMIHMPKGSAYDGYFERVADRIAAVLTDRTRETILRLKYETPEAEKIMGIEYYQAVLRDGVGTYAEFEAWRAANPVTGILEWMP